MVPSLTIKYHCPRCGNNKIIDYGESFDCPVCVLEFEKGDFELFDDEKDILSVEEKHEIVRILFDTNKEK